MNDDRDESPNPEDQHFSLDDLPSNFSDDEEDYSLDELSQAYAQILAEQEALEVPVPQEDGFQASDPEEAIATSGTGDAAGNGSSSVESEEESVRGATFLKPLDRQRANEDLGQEDRIAVTPERIVESILFVGTPDSRQISPRLLASLMRGVSPEEVDQYISKLNQSYEEDGAAYRIHQDELGYRMQLHSSFAPIRNQFYGQVKEARLNQMVIDVLSVIAYHQPVERHEIERLVGRPCGGALNQLVRRNLVQMEKEKKLRLYRTTDRFLDLFGLDEIDDLPQSEAMDDFESQPE